MLPMLLISALLEPHQDAGTVATGKNLAAFELFRNAAGLKDVDINTPGSRHHRPWQS
ncbi:hypothetical protein [Segatella copri]|uniref:Uncharacterized protein n=1 Tax=Segatella copri TaxID=165179 RepID=A0AAW5U0B7_9BACT|nr:hypothetical protein [Segatella copri]MCW4094337.1 hypothetical protein [Segatella copri]